MSIKRRILSSYNSDTTDSSSPSSTLPTMHMPSTSNNEIRSLYRSKSLSFLCQSNIKTFSRRRSSSLPVINILSTDYSSNLIKEQNSIMNTKSKTEPNDLNDGNFSMPMILIIIIINKNSKLINRK